VGSFLFFFIVDTFFKRIASWFPDDPNGRYLTLHILCNGFVTCVHLDDVARSCMFPSAKLRSVAVSSHMLLTCAFVTDLNWQEGYLALDCDTRGVAVIYSLHLYHIVFFQPLPMLDWIHHVVMCIIMLPLAWLLQPGPLLGHGAFFASGWLIQASDRVYEAGARSRNSLPAPETCLRH